jgi:hypothetical protein
MGSKKKKRRNRVKREWAEFQSQYELSDSDIKIAVQTGYQLKKFQELFATEPLDGGVSKAQLIQELHSKQQEKINARQAAIEAGLIQPKEKKKAVKKPKHDPKWAKAKQLCQLNMDEIRKAKELGMSPQGLMKNIPTSQQRWKAPVRVWIQELYEKRMASRKQAIDDSDTKDQNRQTNTPVETPLEFFDDDCPF